MTIFKLPGTSIVSNTITTTQLVTTVVNQISQGGGPKVSGITYPNSATAAANTGSETVVLTGTGFESGVQIYINGNAVPSVTRTNANSLSFTTASLASSTYPVYVVNPDGATAILVPGMRVSGKPIWTTTSPLPQWGKSSALSTTLQANSDSSVTYSLAGGSSLPSGLSLAANGLLSGTLTSPPENTTTYNFTVIATDAEGQTTSSAFSINALAAMIATGGTVSNVGGYRIHTFTSSGTFTVTEGGDVEYLVVAGGGGGGSRHAGGGGAGGFRTGTGMSLTAGSYSVTVGAGGAAGIANGSAPTKGANSSFNGITSLGGGEGGQYPNQNPGGTGGSGGGGANFTGLSGDVGGAGGAGTPGQGNNGGSGSGGAPWAAGGGGGAGSTGFPNPSTSTGGAGGVGLSSSISGSAVFYAGGGGGGGSNSGPGGAGGNGGGGAGGAGESPGTAGTAGTANRGGGGGGTRDTAGGGAGGSGIVIIRYPV
jgi:hypothetical protein